MSYHIFYRSVAIAVPDGKFVIVSESGDNNVYNATGKNKWKRSRTWQSDVLVSNRRNGFYTDLATITDQLNGMEKKRRENPYDPEDNKSALGWFEGVALYGKHTSATFAKNMIAFYRRAIKNAKTIEQYNELGITFYIRTGSDVQHGKEYQIRSTDDLVKYITEFGQEFAGKYYTITAKVWDSSWTKLYPKKVRGVKINTGDYILRVNDGYYLRGGGRRIRYGYSKQSARHMTEKAANNLYNKLRPKFSAQTILEIEKI